mgnify:CR=1 FL=1
MKIVRHTREYLLRARVRERAKIYDEERSLEQIQSIQLALLNKEWNRLVDDVPYYSKLIREKGLPKEFRSIEEFMAAVPITSRAIIKKHISEMTSRSKKADFYRITGGTTAEPIQIPAWREEAIFTSYDMWMARSWYGISPASKLFLLWGHSHLLGTGLKGLLNKSKRILLDWCLGYCRFSAYDLQDKAMKDAGAALLRFKPDYIIGYSVALDRFARVNAFRKKDFQKLGVNVIIGAAESFPSKETPNLLSELFSCPVGMEYGSVETNLIAHSTPKGGYKTFWKSYLVEAEKSATGIGYKVRITSLYPRCFPLVRYEIGDEIIIRDPTRSILPSVVTFESVLGRCNDYVQLADGSLIHSEAFTHAIRWCQEVSAYQVIKNKDTIYIQYTAKEALRKELENAIRDKLSKVHPLLENIEIIHVSSLYRTIAGKTPMILVKPDGAECDHKLRWK